jgi:hypothetical protein
MELEVHEIDVAVYELLKWLPMLEKSPISRDVLKNDGID